MALTKVGYHQISSHPETMPTQTSNSGKFLSTDGTNTSWNTVDALPTQTSQSGKFLTTDGTNSSWGTVSTGVDGIVSTANATAITIDSSENVGLGVTPSTGWHSSMRAFQFGTTGAIWGQAATWSGSWLSDNVYYDGDYKYQTTSGASYHEQDGGVHKFNVAPSGTADAAISWNTGFEVLNSGKARAPNGLLFGSDTAGENSLDDYEEGTWTPTLYNCTGTVSHSKYVKIGGLVYIWCQVNFTGSSGGTITFSVPFTSSEAVVVGAVMMQNVNISGGSTYDTTAYIANTAFQIYLNEDNSGWQTLQPSHVGSNGNVIFSGAYPTQ